MRKTALILLSLLAFVCINAHSQQVDTPAASADVQQPEEVADEAQAEAYDEQDPDPTGIPMIDYGAPKPYTINDIKVFGVKYINTDMLTASSGLSRGDVIYIPGNAISQAVSRLWSQRYFADVKVVADILDGDRVNIEIYLQERPRVYRWLFEGVRKGEASTLTDELKLRRGTELSDYVLDKNAHLIKKHYIDKGFRNVEVYPRIENDSVMQNAVNVTFVVTKNSRVRIGAIDFEGNEEFTDGRLRRTMKKTHRKSINIFRSSKLNDAEYENDKDNVIDFYNSQGFRNAVILKDSMYVINDKRIGIHIVLEEGNKYYIRNVTWIGNTKYPTELLQAIFGMQKGDLYDKKTINKRLGIQGETNPEDPSQISSMYQNEGYLMSSIDPTEIVIGADSIDLEIKIFEGRPFTINEVGITGNLRVDDEVIRRELYTRPGELYNRALLMQTMRQLSQMQHFDPQTLMPNIQPVTNDLVDISWPLTEAASDKFEISGGWGAGMLVLSVGVQLNNLSLRNALNKGAWRPYPQGQNQQLAVHAQSNGSYYSAFSGSFTEPWLGGRKPNSLTVSAYYSKNTNATYITQKPTRFFRTTGVAVGLGRRLSWPDQYFTLYNELGYTSYKLNNWYDYFVISEGSSNIFTFKTVFARSTVNQPIYPSSGSEFSLSLTLTPPYSLWDGKDYPALRQQLSVKQTAYDSSLNNYGSDDERTIAARMDLLAVQQPLYKWIEYHKWMASAKWFFPLTRDQKLVLMTRAEMGYLGSYNPYKVSPFEGFELGGDGMSGYNLYGVDIIAMRGYEDGSLNPYFAEDRNDYAKVYNKYTVELRYPIIMQPQSQIYALVFAEGGNSFKSWKDFDPFFIKRSLGVGIRLYIPFIGMIGVDWGYGFDAPYGSTKRNGGKFHFMLGQQF